MPRITALHMLRSIMKTISAPASSSFRGSLPHPTQPLCTLRVRRRRRLTQRSLPGGLLGLTWAGLTPADRASFAGAFFHSMTSSARVSMVGAMSRPIAFAVLRLITSSNRVRLLDRKITRVCAAYNLVDVKRGAPPQIGTARAVAREPAFGRKFAQLGNHR